MSERTFTDGDVYELHRDSDLDWAKGRSIAGSAEATEPLLDKRVLVTGGAGFIGSAVCRRLAAGNDVTVLDNFATGTENNLDETEVSLVEADVTDRAAVADAVADHDVVLHMAAMMGVRRTLENPLGVLEVNMEGTRNVLHAATDHDVERVLFASTSEVYGDLLSPPYPETTEASPKTNYAVAKLADERYTAAFCDAAGIDYTIVRYFNVYGSKQDSSPYGYVVPMFIARAKADDVVPVYGDGTQTRDFTYIDDAVEATVRALGPDGVSETFNIGTGTETTIRTLAETVVDVVGSGTVEFVENPRPYSITRRGADITKARTTLGYAPQVSLEEGIRRLAAEM